MKQKLEYSRWHLPPSIRWRLPLSYASIALVTALVLGAALITSLYWFYQERERDYLRQNALLLTPVVSAAVVEGSSEQLLEEIGRWAWFSQVRVRIWDAQEVLLVDSDSQPRFSFGLPEVLQRPPNLTGLELTLPPGATGDAFDLSATFFSRFA
jgi:hypothetical protein